MSLSSLTSLIIKFDKYILISRYFVNKTYKRTISYWPCQFYIYVIYINMTKQSILRKSSEETAFHLSVLSEPLQYPRRGPTMAIV
jgi:hypothetical protein